jgi:hypothetical protein
VSLVLSVTVSPRITPTRLPPLTVATVGCAGGLVGGRHGAAEREGGRCDVGRAGTRGGDGVVGRISAAERIDHRHGLAGAHVLVGEASHLMQRQGLGVSVEEVLSMLTDAPDDQ